MKNLSKSERRALAMLIIGEGHLPRRGSSVFIEVGNTQQSVLLDAWRLTGVGSIRKDRPQPGEQPFWRWRVGPVDSVGLLRQLLLYLGFKQPDAIRLIQLYESRRRLAGPKLTVLLRRRTPYSRRHGAASR